MIYRNNGIITDPSPSIAVEGSLGIYNVQDAMFGAKGNGTTDDTNAILKAIRAIPASGGILFFPAGTYLISSVITIPQLVVIEGVGRDASIIQPASGFTGDVFQLSGKGIYIHDVGFNSASQRTGGTYINTATNAATPTFAVDTTVERVGFNNGYDNITVNYSTRVYFRDLSVYNFKNSGILAGNVAACNDIYFTKIVSDNDSANQPAHGVHLTAPANAMGANGIVFTDVDFIHAGIGLLIDCADGGTVEWLFFNQTMFDSCSGDNLLIQDSGTNKTGTIRGIVFNGCWFGTSQNNNIETYTGRGIVFSACRMISAQYNNAFIGQGTNDVSFVGCLLASAGKSASASTSSGASIHIDNGVSASVTGCITTVWDGGNAPTVGLFAGANSNIILVGNDFSGAKTAPTNIDPSATVTMIDKDKSILHEIDGNLSITGVLQKNVTSGSDIAFGVNNYSQAVSANANNVNLGGVQWQINGNAEIAEVLHADTDSSGTVTASRLQWYSYSKNATLLEIDMRSGKVITWHNTLDDGSGNASFAGYVNGQTLQALAQGTATSTTNYASGRIYMTRSFWNTSLATPAEQTGSSSFQVDDTGLIQLIGENGSILWDIDQSANVSIAGDLTVKGNGITSIGGSTGIVHLSVGNGGGVFKFASNGTTGTDGGYIEYVPPTTGNVAKEVSIAGTSASVLDTFRAIATTIKLGDGTTTAVTTPKNTLDDNTGWGHFANGLQIDVLGTGSQVNTLHLHDTASGAPTPDKFLRVSGGKFQILNSAFSADIFDVDDSGNTTIKGDFITSNKLQVSGTASNSFPSIYFNTVGASGFNPSNNLGIYLDSNSGVVNNVGASGYVAVQSQGGTLNKLLQSVSGGFKVQTGQGTFASQAYTANTFYSQSVTFPTAFANAPLVLISLNGHPFNSSAAVTIDAETITTTGFSAVFTTTVGATASVPYTWIAIGS